MAEHRDDETGQDQHVGFGATNVPTGSAPTFGGHHLDAPTSEGPPSEAPEAEAVPGTASVRKTRRPAGAAPAPEPEEWAIVLETQDEQELAHAAQELERGGIRSELEVTSDLSLMRGMERTYGLIVPATEADLARALIEESRASLAALEAIEVEAEPGDEVFLLRDRIDAEMHGASRRQRDREYRRRRRALREQYGSDRQTPISVLLLLVLGVVVFVLLLFAVAG